MITWDYTQLAKAYVNRPAYAEKALNEICNKMELNNNSVACDIGAGVGHLTIELANRHIQVKAVEPNDAMRELGIKRTQNLPNVSWEKGTAETTHQKDASFDAVTFGSSFNVCDQKLALAEARRISKKNAWFTCMWNHRDLDDPIQVEIENIIKKHISNYDYGLRRQDQTDILKSSNLFSSIDFVSAPVIHKQSVVDCIDAWKSHGTLHRQAGDKFNAIINDIEKMLNNLGKEIINIPYTTRIWVAKFAN